jgi:hypothetical protein
MERGQRMIGWLPWGRQSGRAAGGEAHVVQGVSEPVPGDSEEPAVAAGGEVSVAIAGAEMEEGVNAMDDERMQILKMVEEHKITAEEGAKLLAALETSAGGGPAEQVPGRPSRWFRVRVTDAATGRVKVNVNVPLHIVTAVGKLGARFGLTREAEKEGINLDQLFESIQHGAVGKLVDVTNEEGGEHVEIYVE